MVNRPRLLVPNGETGLSDIIPITDAVSKVMTDLLVTSKYAAAPRRWITGMDTGGSDASAKRTGAQVRQKWTDEPASKLWIARPRRRRSGSSPRPRWFPRPGRQRAFGGVWEDAMHLAVLVRDGVQRPGMESLETIWSDPETRTVAQAADAAVKKLSVGVSREQVLRTSATAPTPAEPETFDREYVQKLRDEAAGQPGQGQAQAAPRRPPPDQRRRPGRPARSRRQRTRRDAPTRRITVVL